jgi:CRISPR/Cas system-associated endoribonuclease Cas2
MSSTLPVYDIPEEASERDLQRIRDAVDIAKRNARIRVQYSEFREKYGWETALEMLADRFPVTKWTAKKIVSGQR